MRGMERSEPEIVVRQPPMCCERVLEFRGFQCSVCEEEFDDFDDATKHCDREHGTKYAYEGAVIYTATEFLDHHPDCPFRKDEDPIYIRSYWKAKGVDEDLDIHSFNGGPIEGTSVKEVVEATKRSIMEYLYKEGAPPGTYHIKVFHKEARVGYEGERQFASDRFRLEVEDVDNDDHWTLSSEYYPEERS